MTVKELIELLNKIENQNSEVVTYNNDFDFSLSNISNVKIINKENQEKVLIEWN